MSVFMGAIADDFTGATDLAGLLARSGLRVSLRIGVPQQPAGEDAAPFEVIALKSRTAPVNTAVRQSLAALAWLQAAGAQRFFFKYCSTFDSTAEGNIGPVAEALMDALDVPQTIYCPAFPENGRSIFMGNLFVGELPLAESPMKDHPLTPMRDSNLMRLLAPQVKRPVGLANRLTVDRGAGALRSRLNALAAEGVAHVVVDAVADSDLGVIAAAVKDMRLLTGGSAVAMPLPAIWREEGRISATAGEDAKPQIAQGAVILSGSCSAMTNRQVDRYKASAPSYQLDPVALAEGGIDDAVAWLLAQPMDQAPLLYATAAPDAVRHAQATLGTARAGDVVEEALAALAVAARDAGRRRFVVAGGETSGAVTQALSIEQLTIGAEIAPGVPWCTSMSNGFPVAITLKSGNFGDETFFRDALARFD